MSQGAKPSVSDYLLGCKCGLYGVYSEAGTHEVEVGYF